MPGDFHFLRPEWLLAVPLVAAFAWYSARRRLRPGGWQRVIDPALQPHVLSRAPRAGVDYRWWLVFLGGTLAALALAGPAWQRIEQPVYRSGQAMVVALDLSRSMDAQDVTPSRLARAKLKVLDLLAERQSGQTALVVYSGNAFTVTPLTTDTDTIAALVGSLSTDIMPSQGSNPVAAIEKSRQLLEQAGAAEGEILLITDGGVTPAAIAAAEELEASEYTLSVLGVGTLEGAPIPRAGGGFVTGRNGQIVVPVLEADGLQSLATAGGGHFTAITTDNRDLDFLLSGGFDPAAQSGDELRTDRWRDEGAWLLLALLPIAALAFRRGWILAVLVFALPWPAPAHAFEWNDLWRTDDQQARQALEEGNAAEAAALFDEREWRGVAQYRAGEYRQSATAFSGGEDADSLYNLGNALARQGELEAAIDAYDRALALDPHSEDAAYNRELVQKLLEHRQAQGGEHGNQQAQGSNSSASGESGKPSGDSQQASSSGEAGNTAEPGGERLAEREMNEADLEAMQQELERAAREAAEQDGDDAGQEPQDPAALAAARREQERQQALEQWLRRVPDDPGGLLRRKFRYQYQRQGVDQDGNSLWLPGSVEPW
ncbi:MAG TPA: VWA domain-containing protein [Woeseiaceae bacterium]|nr:VWA domain-containing protein [Woeseiaceae bacterium]